MTSHKVHLFGDSSSVVMTDGQITINGKIHRLSWIESLDEQEWKTLDEYRIEQQPICHDKVDGYRWVSKTDSVGKVKTSTGDVLGNATTFNGGNVYQKGRKRKKTKY